MPPAYLGGTSGCAPNQIQRIHHSKQRMGKLHGHVKNGDQMEGRCQVDPKEMFYFCLSPLLPTELQPPPPWGTLCI